MNVDGLFASIKQGANPRTWSAGVKLSREGAVEGVSEDDGELAFRVRTSARAVPFETFLWPADEDSGCDCGMQGPCVHVVAAVIAARQGVALGSPVPEAAPRFQVALRYDFVRNGPRLSLTRILKFPNGKEEVLKGPLSTTTYMAARGDVQAETLLSKHSGGPLEEERLRRLLVILEGRAEATLDGKPVSLSRDKLKFVVKVRDEGEGFRVGLYRPPGLDALFLGAALLKNTLHPTTYGTLPDTERRALHPRRNDRVFSADRARWIVSDYLPRLRDFGLPVELETTRLPNLEALVPRVVVHLVDEADGLRVRPELVYGDPPVARVRAGSVQVLGNVVPVRDTAAERRVTQQFEQVVGPRSRLTVGFDVVLPPSEAANFLNDQLEQLPVEVHGRDKIDPDRYRIAYAPVEAFVKVASQAGREWETGEGSDFSDDWTLDVKFEGPAGRADPRAVVRAWRSGRSLVPLLDGGYAPLPANWMSEHGALLEELLEARDAEGKIHRNATAALVELLEDTRADVPPDLAKLRGFLDAGEGLPETEPPDHFVAELRPYQTIGFRWMRFLRDMDLHGVLADDMGLGKTVQALALLTDSPGPHLVVAPTSVLPNWEREAGRFSPELKVNRYHGPNRSLEKPADVVLTSYALLRMDLPQLMERSWTYVVLDEAQAIKNPDSQTARAACRVPAGHRLALTGTPVENRLEELWSLFRFLMPGLLGTRATFRDRFIKPIEVGDKEAQRALRARVRPYVLRRLKRQVARDLPALTEIVVRCEMSPAQRKVYEAVRQSARREVLDLLSGPGRREANIAVLEALLRMRQACCDPSLLPGTTGQGAKSAKLDRLEEMLVDLVSEGHKALIFSQWTSLLDHVQPRLEELGISWVRLDGGTRDRQAVIDTFQGDDGPPVFLLSLKAGGTGLNLTAADYVIHLDPWWNPAVQQQATDRAHRIGQERPVVSCKFIAANTVEERILELQEAKKELAELALGADGGMLRSLTSDELRSLFDDAL